MSNTDNDIRNRNGAGNMNQPQSPRPVNEPRRDQPFDQQRAQMKKIETYQDLLEEEQRIELKYLRAKADLATSYDAVKNKLQPANQALSFMNNLMGVPCRPGIMAQGVDIFVDLFAKKYLFRKSNWLVTLAGSYLVRGLSQLVVNKGKVKDPSWSKESFAKKGTDVHPMSQDGLSQAGRAATLNQ